MTVEVFYILFALQYPKNHLYQGETYSRLHFSTIPNNSQACSLILAFSLSNSSNLLS